MIRSRNLFLPLPSPIRAIRVSLLRQSGYGGQVRGNPKILPVASVCDLCVNSQLFSKKSWTVFLAADNNEVPNPKPLTPKTFDDLLASHPHNL